MSTSDAALHGFAFGEHLEGTPLRSLGYRLLAPVEPESWAPEVESLARRLQAAPYPDHWPPVELFCSVLLADGRRLLALARYGLADHTPSHRRSGLELIGGIVPGNLSVSTSLAIYRWLSQRRAATEDLRTFGGQYALTDIVSAVPVLPAGGEPVPILPIRLWEHGALWFAATTPSDPDHYLGLLEQGAGGAWQWLPLVGADFPLQTFAQRGPLVAWTPHLAGVALKLDRKPLEEQTVPIGRRRPYSAILGMLILLLLGANLWATLSWSQRVPVSQPAELPTEVDVKPAPSRHPVDGQPLAFIQALRDLLAIQSGDGEWSRNRLHEVYQRLVKRDERLRVSSPDQQDLVAAVSLLGQRTSARLEALVRDALKNKGYDGELIDLACRRIREQMLAKVSETP